MANKLREKLKLDNDISLMSPSEFTSMIELKYGRKPVPIMLDPNSDPVLTEQQLAEITEFTQSNEHNFIILLTPYLRKMCTEAGLQFVNSEEYSWIHTLLAHHQNYLKPDGFTSLLLKSA